MTHFPLTKHTLPSGLRLVLLPRHDVQTVTFMVLVGVGSRYEMPRQNGLSHYLEHMFFKGTKTRPTAKEIAEAVDNVGGEFNAFTGEEYTGYFVKVAAEHLEVGADVVSDILLEPLFPAEEIERERGVIIEEIRMYSDLPMRHIEHLWNKAQFGDHPLGRRIDGAEDTVSAFVRSDFVDYVQAHYHTKNAVVIVAGNIQEKPTEKLLRELFKNLDQGKETKAKPAPKAQPAMRFLHEYRKTLDQTHLIVGVPGLKHTDKDHWVAELLATILGSGMSSRMFIQVRERHGLAYSVRTTSSSYIDAGSFVTQAGVKTDQTAKALDLMLLEYDRIMSEEVHEAELHKAKQMLQGRMVLELEETNSLAIFAGGQELLTKNIETPAQIWKQVEKITVSDIKRVANRLLDPKKRAVALLSSHKSTKQLEKMLG